jgi:hypothetical protein
MTRAALRLLLSHMHLRSASQRAAVVKAARADAAGGMQ